MNENWRFILKNKTLWKLKHHQCRYHWPEAFKNIFFCSIIGKKSAFHRLTCRLLQFLDSVNICELSSRSCLFICFSVKNYGKIKNVHSKRVKNWCSKHGQKGKIGLQLNQSEKESLTQNGKLASVSTRYWKKFMVSESSWIVLWEFRHISGRVHAHYIITFEKKWVNTWSKPLIRYLNSSS